MQGKLLTTKLGLAGSMDAMLFMFDMVSYETVNDIPWPEGDEVLSEEACAAIQSLLTMNPDKRPRAIAASHFHLDFMKCQFVKIIMVLHYN
ncbi:Hypothetical predicted protein [Octopus vulgaris]|uniref:Uncharacterized protein n=1 Tax=Octopus vulgaris TaxID=6645 RepID=A0AA36AXA7_OCTVU|nr:Hypothetical predicted protein [Octopus vulgaris]